MPAGKRRTHRILKEMKTMWCNTSGDVTLLKYESKNESQLLKSQEKRRFTFKLKHKNQNQQQLKHSVESASRVHCGAGVPYLWSTSSDKNLTQHQPPGWHHVLFLSNEINRNVHRCVRAATARDLRKIHAEQWKWKCSVQSEEEWANVVTNISHSFTSLSIKTYCGF